MGAEQPLTPQWEVELPGTQVLGASVGAASVVVSTYDGAAAGRDAVVAALDLRTGAEHWTDRAGRRTTAAVVVAGRLAISVDRTATTTARSIESGRVRWTRRLRSGAGETPTWSVVAGGGRVYVAGAPVGLVALDSASGAPVWASDPLFLETHHPTTALARGRLLLLDTQQIVSLDVAALRLSSWVWGQGAGFGFAERPVVHGVLGGLVIGSIGNSLLAVDVFGAVRWANTFEGRVVGAAPTADGIVVLIERIIDATGELLHAPHAVGHRLVPALVGLDLAGGERWERPLDGHCELTTVAGRPLVLEDGGLSVLDPHDGRVARRATCPGLEGFLPVPAEPHRVLGAGRHGTRINAWDLTALV